MRVAVIGLPTSGKSSIFQALTGQPAEQGQEPSVFSVAVPDERVDRLSAMYKPKKTIRAAIEFVDLGAAAGMRKDAGELGQAFINAVRQANALLHVIDAFSVPELAAEAAIDAIESVDAELALADLSQAEKRIERIRKEGAKTGPAQRELQLLEEAVEMLGQGLALRTRPELAGVDEFRSFAFLTAKPIITVLNTSEDDPGWVLPELPENLRAARVGELGVVLSLSAGLEAELAELDPAEARAFLADFGIEEPARERVIQTCNDLLGLMNFFTVGEDEVRAWTVRRASTAVEGAAAVHSDIARGFIRAEVVDYQTVIDAGGFDEAKKAGKMRLEGKGYQIVDGDVISYRFNV
jgi:GTP-binding protein YchF